jgi:hypothetical protein
MVSDGFVPRFTRYFIIKQSKPMDSLKNLSFYQGKLNISFAPCFKPALDSNGVWESYASGLKETLFVWFLSKTGNKIIYLMGGRASKRWFKGRATRTKEKVVGLILSLIQFECVLN